MNWLLFNFLVFVFLLFLGYFFGTRANKNHLQSLIKKESELARLPAVATRFPPQDTVYEQTLVSGNTVIANDYFKFFLAGLKSLFGGSLYSYESLLDRARREAVIRMKQQADALGADLIFNVKYTTTNLAAGEQGASGMLEVFAYGTALIRPKSV